LKTLTFVVHAPRQSDQVLEVCSERLLVGSGAHCDIRLALESATWEHVVITQEAGVVMARIAGTGSMAIDGESSREGELREGTSIRVDTTTIVLRKIALENIQKKKSSIGPTIAGAVAMLVVGAALAVLGSASASTTDIAPAAPNPIEAFTAACPERQAAIPLALEKASLARTKRERFRFYPHDGVEGVRYFRVAAACFEDGKATTDAELARADADALESDVKEAFHSSRVRLERALVRKDARTALAQVKLQRELLAENKGAEAYCRWLALLQSKLEAMASKESG
jgi:hypothetical protein